MQTEGWPLFCRSEKVLRRWRASADAHRGRPRQGGLALQAMFRTKAAAQMSDTSGGRRLGRGTATPDARYRLSAFTASVLQLRTLSTGRLQSERTRKASRARSFPDDNAKRAPLPGTCSADFRWLSSMKTFFVHGIDGLLRSDHAVITFPISSQERRPEGSDPRTRLSSAWPPGCRD